MEGPCHRLALASLEGGDFIIHGTSRQEAERGLGVGAQEGLALVKGAEIAPDSSLVKGLPPGTPGRALGRIALFGKWPNAARLELHRTWPDESDRTPHDFDTGEAGFRWDGERWRLEWASAMLGAPRAKKHVLERKHFGVNSTAIPAPIPVVDVCGELPNTVLHDVAPLPDGTVWATGACAKDSKGGGLSNPRRFVARWAPTSKAWRVDPLDGEKASPGNLTGVDGSATLSLAARSNTNAILLAKGPGGTKVLRFEGDAWADEKNLPPVKATSMAWDRSGELWLVGEGQLLRRQQAGWEITPMPPPRFDSKSPKLEPRQVIANRDGELWILATYRPSKKSGPKAPAEHRVLLRRHKPAQPLYCDHKSLRHKP